MQPIQLSQPQEWQIRDLGLQALKIGVVTTVAVTSGIATTILGRYVIQGATIGALLAVSYVVKVITTLNPADSQHATAQKVEIAFHLVIWTGLITGAAVLGSSSSALLYLGMNLKRASSSLELVFTLNHIAFIIGYLIPYGKGLLQKHFNMDAAEKTRHLSQFSEIIKEMQNKNMGVAIRLLSPYFVGNAFNNLSDTVYNHIQFYSKAVPQLDVDEETSIQASARGSMQLLFWFGSQILFTNERIKQLIDEHPRVFNYKYLFETLTHSQIVEIIRPELKEETIVRELQEGLEEVKALNNVDRLIQRENSIGKEDAMELAQYIHELKDLGKKLTHLKQLLSKFPFGIFKNEQTYELIQALQNAYYKPEVESAIQRFTSHLKKLNIDITPKKERSLPLTQTLKQPVLPPLTQWQRIAGVVSDVFFSTFSVALTGVQMYHQPYSMGLGLGLGLVESSLAALPTPKTDITLSLEEKFRELSKKLILTRQSITGGAIGGFLSGHMQSKNVWNYVGPWFGRFKRQTA